MYEVSSSGITTLTELFRAPVLLVYFFVNDLACAAQGQEPLCSEKGLAFITSPFGEVSMFILSVTTYSLLLLVGVWAIQYATRLYKRKIIRT